MLLEVVLVHEPVADDESNSLMVRAFRSSGK